MKEFEIGVDIQKINDFCNTTKGFLSKIFTMREIDYCSKKSKPAQHFAAKFAAKEATIKALSQFKEDIFYKDIEILINGRKPYVEIRKPLTNRYFIKTSISHSGGYALGFVIAMKNGQSKNKSRK